MSSRKIIFIVIGIVCFISIIMAIVFSIMVRNTESSGAQGENKTNIKEQETLKKEFNSLFNNNVEFNNYDTSNVKKLVEDRPIVYTAYELEESKEDKYEVDMHIPVININNNTGNTFNAETQTIFANKAMDILGNSKAYTIYNITYTGYINGDILSVIIKSTLKEGTSAQRTIVQTYNYNLKTEKEVTLEELLEQNQITTSKVSEKINAEITRLIKEANKIQIAGYQTYTRDLNDEIYQIQNISTFFIGQDGKIRIIFAYGNRNFTSEMDIIEL